MPQNEGSFSQFLTNPDNLNLLFEVASARAAQESSPIEPQPQSQATPDIQQLLSLLTHRGGDESREDSPPPSPESGNGNGQSNASVISKMLPQLLQIMNSNAGSLPSDRVNLVRAIKPYAAGKTDHIDRAVRMAGIAKAAKSALGILGKR